jgi:hypothetical protein
LSYSCLTKIFSYSMKLKLFLGTWLRWGTWQLVRSYSPRIPWPPDPENQALSALSAIPSSETVSATGEYVACLHCLLFLHRRQCLQQVSTWRVCIVCYSFIGDSVCNRWARGVSAFSATRSSERVSAASGHLACLHYLLILSCETVSAVCKRWVLDLSALPATPFLWYSVCNRWALCMSALSASCSSESASRASEDSVCCTQEVISWLVCIVCYSLLLIQGLLQVSTWRVCIVLLLAYQKTVSSTGEHVACLHCLLLVHRETVSAIGEHLKRSKQNSPS